jgi:hypothetical protein
MTRRLKPFELSSHSTRDRFNRAICFASEVGLSIRSGGATLSVFLCLEQVIETLPVATDDFAWLCNRVRNAGEYFASRQIFAAAYEIDLVTKRLRARRRLIDDHGS